jgi:DNA helicase HerA-like ATPase
VRQDPTFLGHIRGVSGSTLRVEIAPEIPSASPIIDGRVYRLGQVGSFVRVPLGFLNLYGVITRVGATEVSVHDALDLLEPRGQRSLEVQLVGEAYAGDLFERGVSAFPTIDDEVHVVTEDDLRVIYGTASPSMVPIGTHSASESLIAAVDVDRLVTRHAAIVGSTGSGKSNTVANLLKNLTGGAFPAARIVVIDPHGEYGAAFKDISRVFRIGAADYPLYVPFWALSFDELAWFLIGRTSASESAPELALRDRIFERKRSAAEGLKAGALGAEDVLPDSPVPFDLNALWYELERAERATYQDMNRTQEELIDAGEASAWIPPKFKAAGAGSSPPFLRKPEQTVPGIAPLLGKIAARGRDSRFDFLLRPGGYDGSAKDLDALVASWLDHDQPITVLDLGGVPYEVVDLVVGVLTRILYETQFWGRDLQGLGRKRPLLLVFEEAHSYLPRGEGSRFVPGYAGQAVRRVFKEGRKYGIGAVVVSQRPVELDETVLSQCGTFFALRLSNPDDQGRVRSLAPDALGGVLDLLPVLRTGEALVLGEAMHIPSRVRVELVEPRPDSRDPDVARYWRESAPSSPPYGRAVTAWRKQRAAAPDELGAKT